MKPKASSAGMAVKAALGLAACGLMAVSLMACYGLPQCSSGEMADLDGDGYFSGPASCYIDEPDCNDENANVHPGAEDMLGDDIDQNCDGVDGIAGMSGSGGSAGSAGAAGMAGAAGSGGAGGMSSGGSGGAGGMGSGGSGGMGSGSGGSM